MAAGVANLQDSRGVHMHFLSASLTVSSVYAVARIAELDGSSYMYRYAVSSG